MIGLDRLPGTTNYLIGRDPRRWHTNIPTYGKVREQDVYPGIDLEYYSRAGQLEYDWIAGPGARLDVIATSFGCAPHPCASPARLDGEGDLVVQTDAGSFLQSRPIVYQAFGRQRRPIAARYVLRGAHTIGFAIGRYDPARPLIIDPTLVYATSLIGEDNFGSAAIAVDDQGNAYVTGAASNNFQTVNPIPGGSAYRAGTCPISPFTKPCDHAFVAKLDPSGRSLLYRTYLGGTGDDYGNGVTVDGSGNAYVTGSTTSPDFPTLSAVQPSYGGGTCGQAELAQPCSDAFVAKLNPLGNGLVYSTYLGGNGDDGGRGIAADAAGDAYVTGGTSSPNFPMANAYQSTLSGSDEAFVVKLAPTGNALLYSTYLGGSGGDFGEGIAVDGAGDAYVAGTTGSDNFPVVNALQSANGGAGDLFVSKFTPRGNALVYSTYFGGSGSEEFGGIAVDSAGQAYITGATESTNFPIVNAYQPTLLPSPGYISPHHAFVSKLAASGASLIYSTYLGGTGFDQGGSIAVDTLGDAYAAGDTTASDFPQQDPVQAPSGGYLVKLAPSGNAALYSTYLGPGENHAVAVDSAGSAYVVGLSSGQAYPFISNPPDTGSCWCMYIVKVAAPLPATPTPTATPIPPTATSTVTATPTETHHALHVSVKGHLRAKHANSLRVSVADESGSPVGGAVVRLDGRAVGLPTILKRSTSQQGVATFRNVRPMHPGTATLSVSKSSFPRLTTRLKVGR